MIFTLKNMTRHLVLFALSFLFLYPFVDILNKSYYATISRVNDSEEKTITTLLTYVLENVGAKEVKTSLKVKLDSIQFFDIKISSNNELLMHKPMANMTPNESSATRKTINEFELIITRRKYASAKNDYVFYLKTLFYEPSKLSKNRTFTVLIGHLGIFLFLEVFWLAFSVRYRMKSLTKVIQEKSM